MLTKCEADLMDTARKDIVSRTVSLCSCTTCTSYIRKLEKALPEDVPNMHSMCLQYLKEYRDGTYKVRS